MIIIFGTKSKIIRENNGTFLCPRCQNLKKYLRKSIQTWFTLFFIPVFPVDEKKHTHVECQDCKSAYYKKALDENTFNFDGAEVKN